MRSAYPAWTDGIVRKTTEHRQTKKRRTYLCVRSCVRARVCVCGCFVCGCFVCVRAHDCVCVGVGVVMGVRVRFVRNSVCEYVCVRVRASVC